MLRSKHASLESRIASLNAKTAVKTQNTRKPVKVETPKKVGDEAAKPVEVKQIEVKLNNGEAKPEAEKTNVTAKVKVGGQSVDQMMREKKSKQEAERKNKIQIQSKNKNAFKEQLDANAPQGGTKLVSQGDSNIDKLLKWVAKRINQYPCVEITNFTTSWSDGLAFCALLHYLLGNEAIPPEEVSGTDRRKNFEMAFRVATENGVPELLSVDDMLSSQDPDRRSIITYVHSIYKVLFADKPASKTDE